MARRTMPVSMLSETTKNKYSKEDLKAREEQEEKVKSAFNTSDKLEKKMIDSLDRLEKLFFNEIKSTMIVTNSYTKIDSITISTLANVMAIIYQARKLLKQDGLILNGKQHPSLKIIQQYSVLQCQLFKELSISISERSRLSEMTSDGDFVESQLDNLDSLIDKYL